MLLLFYPDMIENIMDNRVNPMPSTIAPKHLEIMLDHPIARDPNYLLGKLYYWIYLINMDNMDDMENVDNMDNIG
jgi:hypothetical protein